MQSMQLTRFSIPLTLRTSAPKTGPLDNWLLKCQKDSSFNERNKKRSQVCKRKKPFHQHLS